MEKRGECYFEKGDFEAWGEKFVHYRNDWLKAAPGLADVLEGRAGEVSKRLGVNGTVTVTPLRMHPTLYLWSREPMHAQSTGNLGEPLLEGP